MDDPSVRRQVRHRHRPRHRPRQVGRGLVALVLTVVEPLRQLMERQAIRLWSTGPQRRTGGPDRETLMLLDERISDLCDQHGLRLEDLNLDLGPPGSLLPRD
ncbi:gas vesicle protein K [Streptomyces sp. NPDC053560]|uniref:gas vesicle protein K n=1 Tax=Streptomyces sp. NPDC053560 TaxID=3365711 RepID=UPI0037CD9ACD